MLNSVPRQIVFLMIFLVGLGFCLTEGEIGQFDKIFPITGLYVLPPFIAIMFIGNRLLWSSNRKSFFIESLRDACLCSLVVALFIPTANRLIPPSTDFMVDGNITDVKPGKGAITWGLKIALKDGKTIYLAVPRSQFPNVAVGDHFALTLKKGGLGLVYGPER